MTDATGSTEPRQGIDGTVIVGAPEQTLRTDQAQQFEALRPYLFAIAYRLLGSASDAEDIVQESFLRVAAHPPVAMQSPRAYYSTIVTRLCLDALKSARATRESYIGPWLPEPVPTAQLVSSPASPADAAETAEDLSLAVLALLERLAPEERVAYVLREAFDEPYDQIAPIIGKSVAATRQLAHRARERVVDGRTRFAVSPEEHDRVARQFLTAARAGDLPSLLATLAPDVLLVTDAGANARAARRPIVGADKVARGGMATIATFPAETRFTIASINGQRGLLQWVGDDLISATTLSIVNGRIQEILTVVNPEKLRFLARFVSPDDEGSGEIGRSSAPAHEPAE